MHQKLCWLLMTQVTVAKGSYPTTSFIGTSYNLGKISECIVATAYWILLLPVPAAIMPLACHASKRFASTLAQSLNVFSDGKTETRSISDLGKRRAQQFWNSILTHKHCIKNATLRVMTHNETSTAKLATAWLGETAEYGLETEQERV